MRPTHLWEADMTVVEVASVFAKGVFKFDLSSQARRRLVLMLVRAVCL